ncbi:MAG TPA: QsdR family transcriptional regulator [Solirubrobacterales bacterium]|nr:QsdR family transcriptional regulator [Solirubrobacterales bacterium]
MSQISETKGRGRPAAASREDVIDAGLHRYLRGQRVDVQAIAGELGLGRATIYRWFGSREKLLGEVIIRATEPVLAKARSGLAGKGGPGLLDTFDRFNRALADAPALRAFVEQERDAALRIVASGAGIVQPRVVELIAGLIAEEAEAGTYEPAVEPAVLAYAIVKLAQAFLFNDAVVGIRGDVDRLREVEAALLGVPA